MRSLFPLLSYILILTELGFAQVVPPILHYQGNFDSDGVPYSGAATLRFALVSSDGGTTYWSNDGTSFGGNEPASGVSTTVENGACSVRIGDAGLANMLPVAPSVAAVAPDLYLRVWFDDGANGSQLLEPDTPLASVPYAMMAAQAAGLSPGATITSQSIAPGSIDGTKLKPGALGIDHLAAPAAPLPGQVLGFNGDGFAWNNPAPGGGGDSVFSLNGTNDAYYNRGRVGIGTPQPSGALHVAGGGLAVTGEGSPYAGASKGVFIESNPTFGGHLFAYDYQANQARTLMLNFPGGNVGIGTAEPVGKLQVETTWDQNFGANVTLSGDRPSLIWSPAGNGYGDHWLAHMWEGNLTFFNRFTSRFPLDPLGNGGTDTGWQPRLSLIGSTGDIAYSGKLDKLDTNQQFAATVRSADFLLGHWTRRGEPGRALVDWNDGAGTKALVINWADDWPETRIGGAVTEVKTLRITGGSDLAEPFAMSHEGVSPGSVVVIDENHPGKLRRSSVAYDKKVAGIVSGADGIQPGISMLQEDMLEAGENVALSGRVYVDANTGAGTIEPGDLLTTSDIPGEAMKAADHDRSQGAILGKAMTPLRDGSGRVLVLVTLQ